MSRKVEYINPAGLRLDGRRGFEHRRVACDFGTLDNCDGSCVVTSGGTTVLARVQGPKELGRGAAQQDATLADRVVVTCDVAITAFAGERRRHMAATAGSRASEDISRAVQSIAQSLVLTSQYPPSSIHIRIDVLHHDGSEKATAINAACLALLDASIAIRGIVVAATVGVLDSQLVCDLSATEIRSQCPTLCAAFLVTAGGSSSGGNDGSNVSFLELNSRVSEAMLDDMMREAAACAHNLHKSIAPVLRSHAQDARSALQQSQGKR
jgi:exosome complex component RRP41